MNHFNKFSVFLNVRFVKTKKNLCCIVQDLVTIEMWSNKKMCLVNIYRGRQLRDLKNIHEAETQTFSVSL